MSPRWRSRRPQFPYPHKDQLFDSYPWTNQLWESSRVHLRNFSNTVEQKKSENNYTKRKGKTASFCLHYPTPQMGTVQCQEGMPQLEKNPLTGKVQTSEQQGSSTSWGTMQVPTLVSPQRAAKLRCREMAKSKEEDKGQPISATQWEQRQFPVTFQEKERERDLK